ncbi:MAG: signal peptide peptidase SppA [Steroidobacteraceae bacterium]
MKAIATVFRFLGRALDLLRRTLHLLLLLVIFGLIVAALAPRVPAVPTKAALVIKPEGDLVEQLSGNPVERAVAEAYGQGTPETLVRDLVDAINAAKTDGRIRALVLDLSWMTGGGIPKLEEVAAAIRDFKRSGKPVIALGEYYDQSQYYLAAHANEIYLDPQGLVLIEGYGYYRMFFKNALDKLAVDVNIFKVGTYKSYTDQFTRTEMGESEREASLVWLNVLWREYQDGVTRARGLKPDAVNSYVEQLVPAMREKKGDMAAVALDSGLVTQLRSRHDVEEHIKKLVGEDDSGESFSGIDQWDYLHSVHAQRSLSASGKKVGVIVAAGEILDGDQPPGTIGDDSMVDLIRQAREDDDVKAVVLRIDSPGGSMMASEVIRRELDALKAAGKPVIASMSSTAASGGYYIAMDADEIWANPATLTGSIGVFTVFPTIERTLEKVGVTVDGLGTTQLAGALRIDRTLTDEQRELLQLGVEHAYRTFTGHVANARRQSVETVDSIAQGRVWSGRDALRIGLVDKLGSYEQAVAAAAKRAKLGTEFDVEVIEPPFGWREAFAREAQALGTRIARAALPQDHVMKKLHAAISPLESELKRLANFTDWRSPAYYCMCTVK